MNKTTARLAVLVAIGMMLTVAATVSLCVGGYEAGLNPGDSTVTLVAWGALLGTGVFVTCGCMVMLSRQIGRAPRIGDR